MQKGGTSPDKHLQGCATLPRVIHPLPGTEAKLLTPTCERPNPKGLPAAAHAWTPRSTLTSALHTEGDAIRERIIECLLFTPKLQMQSCLWNFT